MRIATVVFLLAALTASLGACGPPASERSRRLAELESFVRLSVPEAATPSFEERLRALRIVDTPDLSHRELAWLLVGMLRLGYRLRHADGPSECQDLLEEMGLMRPASGASPVPSLELRLLLNRAPLPETELLLSTSGPLPDLFPRP